jgi:hypothetical protein
MSLIQPPSCRYQSVRRADAPFDERAAGRDPRLVALSAARGGGDLRAAVDAGPRERGLRRDVTHRAALGAGAEQRTLRSAQHFHAIDVEGFRQRFVGIEGERAHLDRRVVEVDTGGAGAARAGNATDRDVVGAGGIEIHSRSEAGDLGKVLDAAQVEVLLGERGHADRHLAQAFLAARCRDDDFLQADGRRRLLGGLRRLLIAPRHRSATSQSRRHELRARTGAYGSVPVIAPHGASPKQSVVVVEPHNRCSDLFTR